MVAGTEHTRDYVVQRELQVHEGEPLSQQDLLNTQTRLYDLGIFSQVDTAVQNPEGTDPQKNVLVQVRGGQALHLHLRTRTGVRNRSAGRNQRPARHDRSESQSRV